jgi:hypothetical protein
MVVVVVGVLLDSLVQLGRWLLQLLQLLRLLRQRLLLSLRSGAGLLTLWCGG